MSGPSSTSTPAWIAEELVARATNRRVVALIMLGGYGRPILDLAPTKAINPNGGMLTTGPGDTFLEPAK
jgi:hypothetical protein